MKMLPSRPPKRAGRARKGEGSLRLRGGVYYYRIPNPDGGKPICRSCETSDYRIAVARKAEAILAARAGKLRPTGELRQKEVTTAEVIADYMARLEAKARHKQKAEPDSDAVRNMSSVRGAMGHLVRLLGHVPAAKLSTADIDGFRNQREERDGVLFSTANHELRYLRAALRMALNATPPRIPHVPKIWMPSEKSQIREGFVGRESGYLPILRALPDSLRAIFVLGFHTGARSGELKKITWSMIDWDRSIIQIRARTAKNGEGRFLPVWGDVREFLLWQKEIRDRDFPECPWVFFRHRKAKSRVEGQQLGGFTREWKAAVKKAGFPGTIFHDLRRSAIRYADQEAGIDSASVRRMSGHRSESVYSRYNFRNAADMTRLADRFDRHLEESGGPRGLHIVKKTA